MADQLYIKTDGPIPEGCDYITKGKVYALADPITYDGVLQGGYFIDDHGLILSVYLRESSHLNDADWTLCDQHGNPVPAPWESTKRPKLRGEEGDLCACHASPEWNVASWKIPICEHPEYSEKDGLCLHCDHARKCHEEGFYSPQGPLNSRAHAEALAEALELARIDLKEWLKSFPNASREPTVKTIERIDAALAAFDQAQQIEGES